MKQSRFTEQQIAFALKQAETGPPVAEVIRRMGISEQTFYRRKKLYGRLGAGELRPLTQLEEEHRRLKQLVAVRQASKSSSSDQQMRGNSPDPIAKERWWILPSPPVLPSISTL